MQFLQANIINIVNDVLKQHVDIKLNDVLEKNMKGFYIYIYIYSQVHKYWDIDTIKKKMALYTTTMDFKWNEQDVL